MAVEKLYNPGILLGGYDVQADHSLIRVAQTVPVLDRTAFGNTTRHHLGGLGEVAVNGEVYQQSGVGLIETLLSSWRGGMVVFTVTPNGIAVGDRAIFGEALLKGDGPMGGAVGEMHKTSWSAVGGTSPAVIGQIFKAAGATTTSSNSSAVQLGAIGTAQKLWAAIHVLSVSGTAPTLDVVIESDNAGAFSSPVTRITFAQKTAAGAAEVGSASSAGSDDYWRVKWTIGGSATPTFSFIVALGLGGL